MLLVLMQIFVALLSSFALCQPISRDSFARSLVTTRSDSPDRIRSMGELDLFLDQEGMFERSPERRRSRSRSPGRAATPPGRRAYLDSIHKEAVKLHELVKGEVKPGLSTTTIIANCRSKSRSITQSDSRLREVIADVRKFHDTVTVEEAMQIRYWHKKDPADVGVIAKRFKRKFPNSKATDQDIIQQYKAFDKA